MRQLAVQAFRFCHIGHGKERKFFVFGTQVMHLCAVGSLLNRNSGAVCGVFLRNRRNITAEVFSGTVTVHLRFCFCRGRESAVIPNDTLFCFIADKNRSILVHDGLEHYVAENRI